MGTTLPAETSVLGRRLLKPAVARANVDNYWILVIPTIVVVAVGFWAPLAYAAWLSLRDFNLLRGTDRLIGLGNYIRILSNAEFFAVVMRTFCYVAVVTALDFVFGFAQALLVYELESKLARVVRGVFLFPILLIPSASAMFWRMIMYGPPNVQFLRMFGLQNVIGPPLSEPTLAMVAIVITSFWAWSPWAFLLLLGGLESLDPSPMEAARVDGVSYRQIVWHIILPLMKPVIFATLSFKAVDSFLTFSFVWLMTEGGPGKSTHLLSTYVYQQAFRFLNYGYGSAMAMMMVAISGILSVVAVHYWQNAQERS
jgi:multiple sugar transport system permease protein